MRLYMNERITKKVVIDPYRGGEDIGNNANGIIEKDYNLEISKYIYDRLQALGVPVSLTRQTDETLDMVNRLNRIQSYYGTGNDVIVLSNALTTGEDKAEIVYALRNSNSLSSSLAKELETAGLTVKKFYQRRLPSDTSKDYNQLLRDTKNNESLIIYYGNIDNPTEADFLKNNLSSIGEAVVIGLTNYLNIPYQPISGSNYYIVKKGDSLYSIANQFHTTPTEIKELNNLSTNNLSIGQVLKIPKPQETPPIEETEQSYVVKSGDSLYKIANTYHITVDDLKKYNQLTTNILSVGQVLKIPSSTEINGEETVTYQVKSGDSLYSIAKKYNTTVNDLKTLNNLSSNLLSIGQNLKIPPLSPTSPSTPTYLTYQVVTGDTLYSIAKIYNTTISELKKLNNLMTDNLTIGQTLKIPTIKSDSNYITYKVVSGDSLYSIAKNFNTTVPELKNFNNLTSNLLSIGQLLKIPR